MPAPPEELRQWLDKASVDLRAARVLLGKVPAEVACFHLQQAAEKAIKGMLALRGVAPPRSHDLRALLALFPPPAPDFDLSRAEALTPYAALTRYPGFSVQPDEKSVAAFEDFASACVQALQTAIGESAS